MSMIARLIALMEAITPSQIRALTPAQRQQLAAQALRVLREAMATHQPARPKSGVLAQLERERAP